MRQGLLAINVLARLDGRAGDDCVSVVGCGNDDGIDLFLLGQELAKIGVHLGFREFLKGLGGIGAVHVTERVQVLAADCLNIAEAHSAHPDAGDIDLLTRGHKPRPAQHVPRHQGYRRSSGAGLLQKLTSFHWFHKSNSHGPLVYHRSAISSSWAGL